MEDRIQIIEYHPRYALETTRMWRDSKEKALGVKEKFSFHRLGNPFLHSLHPRRLAALDRLPDRLQGGNGFKTIFGMETVAFYWGLPGFGILFYTEYAELVCRSTERACRLAFSGGQALAIQVLTPRRGRIQCCKTTQAIKNAIR